MCHKHILSVFLKRFYLFLYRERGREAERERERKIDVWESNQRLLGSQAGTQSTGPHQPGLLPVLKKLNSLLKPNLVLADMGGRRLTENNGKSAEWSHDPALLSNILPDSKNQK